jgi:rhodanese-related sulfurtransferase
MFQKLFGRGSASAVKQLSVAELQTKIAAKEPLQIVDVRSADEYRNDGHIAGAKLIPLPMLAQRLGEISRDLPVALVCRSGGRSQAAADLLAREGFTSVINVQGGMMAWRGAGYKTR